MELILWRHAEAKDGTPDEARPLSRKGRGDASRMARWLNAHLPQNCRILVSPAVRAVQTAEALERKFKLHPGLAPGAYPEDILEAAKWPDARGCVLVVGHQPSLGQVASLLVAGAPQDWRIRRSAVWWIAQRKRGDASSNYIRAVMAPDLAGGK